jgi:predicted ATPase
MLLEQPEDSIHSGLMKKLIGLLRSNVDPTQLVVATHSPSVFNRLSPEEVRLVTMSDGSTDARQLTQRELEAAEKFITAEGSLAEFLDTVQEG